MKIRFETDDLGFNAQDSETHIPLGTGLQTPEADDYGTLEETNHILTASEQREIVAVLQGDDELLAGEAYVRAVEALQSRCRHLVSGIIGESYVVDDIVQDVFTRALWVKIKEQPADTKLATYVLTCMRNAAVSESKKLDGRETDYVDPMDAEMPKTLEYQSTPSPTNPARDVEIKDAVAYAMSTLSEQDKKIVGLHYVDGYKYAEIAEMLGMKTNTLKRRASTAIKKMREILTQEFGITADAIA